MAKRFMIASEPAIMHAKVEKNEQQFHQRGSLYCSSPRENHPSLDQDLRRLHRCLTKNGGEMTLSLSPRLCVRDAKGKGRDGEEECHGRGNNGADAFARMLAPCMPCSLLEICGCARSVITPLLFAESRPPREECRKATEYKTKG